MTGPDSTADTDPTNDNAPAPRPAPAATDTTNQDSTREAMDRLNDRNRILVEARMLPSHAALAPEKIAEIVEHFKAYILQHDLTAAKVAREVQYSPAVVSTWMAGTYKGDVGKVTLAINNWMERDARRRLARRPSDYVPTWLAEDFRTTVSLADKHCKMAVIVAPSGTGKTKVVKALAEELRGLYVSCTDRMRLTSFYHALATAMGWEREKASKYVLQKFIIERLAGTNRIIFIDEAHQLGRDISSVRTIYDQAQTPIVMVGTDEIATLSSDRHHGRGQFASRCIHYNALDHAYNAEAGPGGSAEGKDLFTVEEIRAFFAKKKIRLADDGMKLMWAIACLPGHGCLRLVEDVVRFAYDLSDNDGEDVLTREDLLAAMDVALSGGAKHLNRLAARQLERWPKAPAAVRAAG